MFNKYNFFLLNYGITWLILSIDYKFGLVYFIVFWLSLIAIKIFILILRAKLITIIITIIALFFSAIIASLVAYLLPLILLLLVLKQALKNFWVIIGGISLYGVLFTVPPKLNSWISYNMTPEYFCFVSFVAGVSTVLFASFLMKNVGVANKDIQNVMLGLPLFFVSLTYGIMQGSKFGNDS